MRAVVLTGSYGVADTLARSLRGNGWETVISAKGQPDDLLSLLKPCQPDLVVCWGYPHLVPADVLALPRFGCINMHPSLLPRHRGRIPLAWALREGDPSWGVTWHRMDAGFDTGRILAQDTVPIEDDDVEPVDIEAKVGAKALEMLPWVLDRVSRLDRGRPQLGTPTYAPRFVEDDYARIDLSQTARYVHNQVRGWSMNRYPFDAPVLSVGGERIVVRRTSLEQADGLQVECADAPIWIVR